jgi:uncharacterized membrane protein YhaH (DUF805 family)
LPAGSTGAAIKQPVERQQLKKFLHNLFSTEGRLNRIGFFHTAIFMLCLFILLSFINSVYIRNTDSALTVYLYVKSLQTMLLLALWTPSIIKRLHDLDIKGNRVWIAWAALLLDVHNLMLLNIHVAAFLEKIQPMLFLFYAIVLIFYLVLFLMPGSRGINNWGPPQDL